MSEGPASDTAAKADGAPPDKKASRSPSFVRHLHAATVDVRTLAPLTTLGLGLAALYLAAILLITGLLLMVYYVPSTAGAYSSVQDIVAVVPFGRLLRNMHRWAGHGLVAVVLLHLVRVLLTGSYGQGRAGVWSAGIWLLLITLAFAFTGYLLPWDQLSYWAVNIGAHFASNVPLLGDWLGRALLGADGMSEATLVRFYALHVGILPLAMTIFVALHLYRLRRAGGLAKPTGYQARRLPAWPHLYERELALLMLVVAATVVVGLGFDAPLGAEPDIAHPDNPSKAPWYFLAVQELVSYSMVLGGVVIPAGTLLLLYMVPRIDRDRANAGSWLAPAGGWAAVLAGAVFAGLAVTGGLALQERGVSWIHPALLLALGCPLLAGIFAWRCRSARMSVLVMVGCAASAWIILTLVGLLMRGHSWTLVL